MRTGKALSGDHPERGGAIAEARKWELSHGGMSGRAAQQLIYDLSGKALMKQAQEVKKDRER
ncbi:MAG: hypothetical protein ACLTCB_04595 [Merdibacter sp.]